ncbi:hypothetical protein GQ457_13G015500 [Hibiscus cannabinus]
MQITSLVEARRQEDQDKPSIEQPPKLELKQLPEQLKYAYLGNNKTLPVIISSKLQEDQEERLIATLRHHKEALGWSIADIKGISPTICMHKILLDDNHKPTVDAQRRLNQAMKDVVRKEILKWLDAGIIYPISDSEWVSPVQCVPKKGGITVISNEKNDDYAVGAVLGQRKGKIFHPIYYANKTLNDAQVNYTTTEKEMLAVIFAFDKFRSYLIGTKLIASAEDPAEKSTPWYADFVNYIVSRILPHQLNYQGRKRFRHNAKGYFWDEPYLFKQCADQIIRRCIPEKEQQMILEQCHSAPYGGHFGRNKTTTKVLQSGFYWPTLHRDAQLFCQQCDRCQRTGNISKRNEMPLQNILEVELFDVWGIDFMGPFPSSFGNL